MANRNPYIGSTLKFLVEPIAENFDKNRDNFTVTVSVDADTKQTWQKSELVEDALGNYYVVFDTEDFGPGRYLLTVTTYTPDADFDGGYRIDVEQVHLCTVLKLKHTEEEDE